LVNGAFLTINVNVLMTTGLLPWLKAMTCSNYMFKLEAIATDGRMTPSGSMSLARTLVGRMSGDEHRRVGIVLAEGLCNLVGENHFG
jgi:hypothetical protein